MTDVSATSRSNAPNTRPTARTPQRATPPAEDVRAMGEAFRRARGGTGQPDGLSGRAAVGKGAQPATRGGERGADATAVAGWHAADERAALDRREGERHADQGFGGMAQQAAAPVVIPAQGPSPLVDPSGFAQMLADLWTRENGRGPREVRVRFGTSTWPATGARLVRSADGLLDVTVEMAPGFGDARTDRLQAALEETGLSIGRVDVADSLSA